jgi:hypothetical protein
MFQVPCSKFLIPGSKFQVELHFNVEHGTWNILFLFVSFKIINKAVDQTLQAAASLLDGQKTFLWKVPDVESGISETPDFCFASAGNGELPLVS